MLKPKCRSIVLERAETSYLQLDAQRGPRPWSQRVHFYGHNEWKVEAIRTQSVVLHWAAITSKSHHSLLKDTTSGSQWQPERFDTTWGLWATTLVWQVRGLELRT